MPATVQELAEKVIVARQRAWDKSDPTTGAVIAGVLSAEDEQAIRRLVSEAGYLGAELDEMAERVKARLVGKMEAMVDDMPTASGS